MRGGIALECCQWDGKLFLSKTKTIRDIHLFMEIGVNWLRIIKFNKKTRHQLIYGNWRKLALHEWTLLTASWKSSSTAANNDLWIVGARSMIMI